jgi:hypothetical protein
MTKRHPLAKPDLRDRWSFDDDPPVASTARANEWSEAPRDEAPQARADEWSERRPDSAPQWPFADPQDAQAAPPYRAPVERDLLFRPAAARSRSAPDPAAASAPVTPPHAARPAWHAAPSPWATIRVSDKARARAAAAGLHRYVEEKRASPRASWVIVSTIVLLTAGAAFGLYILADPQAPATIQSAETPAGEPDADRPSAAIEVPPEGPAMAAPAREAPPGAALDTPLIEVAP